MILYSYTHTYAYTQRRIFNIDVCTQHLILYLFLNPGSEVARHLAQTCPSRPVEFHMAALAPTLTSFPNTSQGLVTLWS